MNILVTGNYATGSSAAYDYLREFDTIGLPFGIEDGYEHALFYIQHGIIELESILFGDAGYISTDAAIRSFLEISMNVYQNNYKYYGGFKKHIGPKFVEMTNDFVNEIAIPFNARTIGKNKKMYFSPIKACGQVIFAVLKKYKIQSFGMAYKEKKGPGYVLKVNHDEFIEAKKKYISRYMELTKSDKANTLYDHLLLPINFKHLKDFKDDTKLVYVDRDPRDLYCLIKKHYMTNAKIGFEKPPFAIGNVNEFIDSFLAFRRDIKIDKKDKRILVLNFEDIVLNYEDFAVKMNEFCGISEENHVRKYKCFNPAISANNVNIYKELNAEEIKVIEERLKDYLFDFSKIDFSKVKKEDAEVF